MIRTSNNFIIYDDDKIPYPGTYKDLRKYATDLVLIKKVLLRERVWGKLQSTGTRDEKCMFSST